MNFSSRQLRAFHLVARLGSFSRAAEALFITPSGLSLLIRELEDHLGFRLFDRTTRRVALTADGAELLEVSERSLQDLDAVMIRLAQRVKGASRTIAVGTTPLVAASILAPAIREYRRLHPAVRVQLFDGDIAAIQQRVESGKLDLGLGIFGSVPGIRRTPFFRFSLMVIRPDRNEAAPPATTTWAQLNGQTLISLAASYPHQQLIDRQLAKAGAVCGCDQVVNLLDTQIALVEADQGIAIIPSFGLPVARQRKVITSRLINPELYLDFHQISDRGKRLPRGAEEFTAFLKSYISRWAGSAGVR
jgi:DNA-binding transcriptional LysR family regulator